MSRTIIEIPPVERLGASVCFDGDRIFVEQADNGHLILGVDEAEEVAQAILEVVATARELRKEARSEGE